jgi:RNA polymerase sigma-70 factor (ECF subfamily)
VRALTGSKDESAWAADLNLLRRTLEADAAAEEEFVQRMVCIPRFLQRFDARMGQPFDSHQIDDLSQEVAARVWRDRERFAGGSRLESWVFGYARHVFLEALGTERVRAGRDGSLESVSLEQPDDATPIDTAVAMQLDAQIVLDQVDALPERERVLIRMKLFHGATFTEIARRTGEDVSALKTRYYRAIQRVREKLNVDAAVSRSGIRGSGNREERR